MGSTIYHGNKDLPAVDGKLDVDANYMQIVEEPVENVYIKKPIDGQYTVNVKLFSYNSVPSDTEVPFRVRLLRTGEEEQNFEGFLKGVLSQLTAFTFNYGTGDSTVTKAPSRGNSAVARRQSSRG